jgi:hypothetical protein
MDGKRGKKAAKRIKASFFNASAAHGMRQEGLAS